MFKLKQTETPAFKRMFIVCSCGKETNFTGTTCPIVCHHCSEIVPDAIDIHYNSKERVIYHIDKEIFV